MDKKKIQKRRMMSYFIEAADKVIEDEGLDSVTIRKVADLAGYNSATLYNYFENIEHLIFFSSMKYLKDYVLDLPNYLVEAHNPIERYLGIWRCFCKHSYSKPHFFSNIFFNKFSGSVKETITEYYSIFPEELGQQPEYLLKMLLKHSIYDRNFSLLEDCMVEGYLKEEDLEDINEMTLLLYQGMLNSLITKQLDYTVAEATVQTLKHLHQIIMSYSIKQS
ncbi:MAG: TetR/AcrR family transcriptional regulator [Bacillota bacterium]|nr:TetR/AcrR family transcriptional regulator [Bacillota bacterium]